MRKIISIAISLLLVISFVSCQSNKISDDANKRKDAFAAEIFGSVVNVEVSKVDDIQNTTISTEQSTENIVEESTLNNQVSEEVTSLEKGIYDYPFDVEAIKQELILIGEGTGMTHITTDEGILRTPDNSSWSGYDTASENFQGAILERNLKEAVSGIKQMFIDYGWTAIDYFTVYVEDIGDGSYRFYILY